MKNADREHVMKQLAEVTRDRLGRFAQIEYLRTCDPLAGCGVDADMAAAIEGVDAFLETIETLVQITDPDEVRELAETVRAYRQTLRDDLEELDAAEELDGDPAVLRRDAPARPMWVEGSGVGEVMDVTGLTGRESSTLALLLNRWTNEGNKRRTSVYNWRNGKRYMRGPSFLRVDLNHAAMAPFRDDILAAMSDPDSRREFQLDMDAELNAADGDDFGAAQEHADRARAAREGRPQPARVARPPAATPAKPAKRKKSTTLGAKANVAPAGRRRPNATKPKIVQIDAAELLADKTVRSSIHAYDVGAFAVGRPLTSDHRDERTRAALEKRGGAWAIYHKRTGLKAATVFGSRKTALAAAWGFQRINDELGDHGTWGESKGIPQRWMYAGANYGAKIATLKTLSFDAAETFARAAIDVADAGLEKQRANVGKKKRAPKKRTPANQTGARRLERSS